MVLVTTFGPMCLDCVRDREGIDIGDRFAEGIESEFVTAERQVKVLVGISIADFYTGNFLRYWSVTHSNMTHQLPGREKDRSIMDFDCLFLIDAEHTLHSLSWSQSRQEREIISYRKYTVMHALCLQMAF